METHTAGVRHFSLTLELRGRSDRERERGQHRHKAGAQNVKEKLLRIIK